MAILERIRSKSGLAVGAVGVALLLFVISDALNSNSSMFGGRGSGTAVGEVDGDKIDIKVFEAKFQENEEAYKQRSKQDNLDANMQDMVREQTWNQLVQEIIQDKEYADLGIKVTNDELFDLVQGENPHDQIRTAPIFQSKETGQFDHSLVVRFLKQMIESTDEQAKLQWAQFEDGLMKETASKKYNALLTKGLYATSLDGKAKGIERNRTVDFQIIPMIFASVPDTLIKTEDGDLKSYFNKNRDKYREKENARKLDFVMFDVTPTSEDSASILKWAEDQAMQFATATNDTLYTDLNSETKFDTIPHAINYYPEEIADRIFSEPKGSIVGPFYKDGKYRIYKSTAFLDDSLYTMRASHILFKVDGPTKADTLKTMQKAQEVMAEIRKGASFAEKAAQYGTDGTSSRGGDLGWFREGSMVKEFGDFARNKNNGEMGIVKTQFGVHIVKITGEKTKKLVCAAVVERSIKPSDKTSNIAYNQASQFAVSLADNEDLDKMAAEKGLSKRQADNVKENDKSLAGFQDAREVIRWVFNAKTGEISDVFTLGDKFIVARLVGVKEKDKSNYENVKDRVEVDYRNEKKAEMLIEKAKTAMNGVKTLEDIATKLQIPVAPIPNQNFDNSNISFSGTDHTFTGIIFGTKSTGKILGPVKGDNAIYIYQISKFNEPDPQADNNNFKQEVQSRFSQRMETGAFETLKEINNVKDNRSRFY